MLFDDRTYYKRNTGKPVLIVLHQERSSPGRVGHLLLEKGL